MTDDRKNTAEYAHFGGRTFETADGSEHDTGFVLQTGTYMGFGFGDGSSIAILFCLEPMLVVAAAQEVNYSSVIAFQMMGQFKTLEFDVCSIAGKSSGISKNLKVIGNGEELSAFVVTSGERQHFTVNISGVNDLAFFLEYGEGSTIPFGFFNVMASN